MTFFACTSISTSCMICVFGTHVGVILLLNFYCFSHACAIIWLNTNGFVHEPRLEPRNMPSGHRDEPLLERYPITWSIYCNIIRIFCCHDYNIGGLGTGHKQINVVTKGSNNLGDLVNPFEPMFTS